MNQTYKNQVTLLLNILPEVAKENDKDSKGNIMEKIIGTVKWFSKEKGYGFLTDNNNQDYYFHVTDVQGATLPDSGDQVEFISGKGSKGLKASSVSILQKGVRTDSRVTCPHCNKEIVPRLYFRQGEATHSFCPFCGKLYQEFEQKQLEGCLSPAIFWFLLIAIAVVLFLVYS